MKRLLQLWDLFFRKFHLRQLLLNNMTHPVYFLYCAILTNLFLYRFQKITEVEATGIGVEAVSLMVPEVLGPLTTPRPRLRLWKGPPSRLAPCYYDYYGPHAPILSLTVPLAAPHGRLDLIYGHFIFYIPSYCPYAPNGVSCSLRLINHHGNNRGFKIQRTFVHAFVGFLKIDSFLETDSELWFFFWHRI